MYTNIFKRKASKYLDREHKDEAFKQAELKLSNYVQSLC